MTQLPERKEPGKWRALLFSIAVHTGLLGILIFGVYWKNRPPEAVQVELWSAAPPQAVREEPRPEPAPIPKPEPVVEEPPKIKAEIEEKVEPTPVPKPDPVVEKPPKIKPDIKEKVEPTPKPRERKPDFSELLRREDAERESRIRNQAAMEAASAARLRREAEYAEKIRAKVRGNIVLPLNIQGNPEAVFEITQLPDGSVVSVRPSRSSGNPSLDAAIERAILKSSPLPKPDNPELFSRIINLHYRPIDE